MKNFDEKLKFYEQKLIELQATNLQMRVTLNEWEIQFKDAYDTYWTIKGVFSNENSKI